MSQDVVSKWGPDVAEGGFSQIPHYLILINQFVHEDHQLKATEMFVLLQLVAIWWKAGEMPYPSVNSLAKRTGISERQVQRAIKSLEEKGYVKREKKKTGVIASNVYDLSPSVRILQEVAKHFKSDNPRKLWSSAGKNKGTIKPPGSEK